jgi:hypothetical protein
MSEKYDVRTVIHFKIRFNVTTECHRIFYSVSASGQGNFGYFLKSGSRFSKNAFLPS